MIHRFIHISDHIYVRALYALYLLFKSVLLFSVIIIMLTILWDSKGYHHLPQFELFLTFLLLFLILLSDFRYTFDSFAYPPSFSCCLESHPLSIFYSLSLSSSLFPFILSLSLSFILSLFLFYLPLYLSLYISPSLHLFLSLLLSLVSFTESMPTRKQ